MRVVGTLLGFAAVLAVGCGARTGLALEERDGGEAPPLPEGGTDTFPCRWTVGAPLELERDPSDICAVNGAISATASEALLVWQDVSCDLLPFEGVPAVIATLTDPPAVILTGTMPHPFGHYAGITEGYLFAESSPNVGLFSSRMEPLELQKTELVEVLGIDRIDPNRVYGWDGDGIAEWSTRGRRRVGPGFPVPRAVFLAQLLPGDVWVGVTDGELFRSRAGGFPETLMLPIAPQSITPDHFNPGIAVLGPAGTIHRIDVAAGEGARFLTAGPRAMPAGPIASNETEALVPLSDGSILIQRMNGAPAGLLIFTTDDVRQARVLLRAGTSVGGILSIERTRETGENVVRFRPMVCNR